MIRGWRLYAVTEDGVMSGVKGAPLDKDAPAACGDEGFYWMRCDESAPPNEEHTCGYYLAREREDLCYALGDRTDLDNVFRSMLSVCLCPDCQEAYHGYDDKPNGLVVTTIAVAWGKVVPHERGWRAQYVNVERVVAAHVPHPELYVGSTELVPAVPWPLDMLARLSSRYGVPVPGTVSTFR